MIVVKSGLSFSFQHSLIDRMDLLPSDFDSMQSFVSVENSITIDDISLTSKSVVKEIKTQREMKIFFVFFQIKEKIFMNENRFNFAIQRLPAGKSHAATFQDQSLYERILLLQFMFFTCFFLIEIDQILVIQVKSNVQVVTLLKIYLGEEKMQCNV